MMEGLREEVPRRVSRVLHQRWVLAVVAVAAAAAAAAAVVVVFESYRRDLLP